MVRAEGGAGVGGRGEACTSRAHEGNDAHTPPLSIDLFCWSPLCYPLFYSLVLFFFCKNRATIAENVVAFRGTVCQWYAEPEYPDEMRIRPHPALGQYRVFRNRFHPATICVGRLDAFAETMPARFYIAQENESKNTSNGPAEPE